MASALGCHQAALGACNRMRVLACAPAFSALKVLPSRRGLHQEVRCVKRSRPHTLSCHADANGTGENYTVTTPLYYVNAAPHMGSAYPTIAADVVARFQRLKGRNVRFITGTDEHGEKIALAAAKRDMTPKEHCDSVVQDYKSLWKQLNIKYDRFIRTTDAAHEALVAQVLQRVWEAGDIYKSDYEGYYCVDCEEYKDEKELDEQHNCPTHRRPCTHRKEENYFFRLSRYQQQLEDLVIHNEHFVQPNYRRNEVAGWVKEGARDFSISRSAVEWGIPVPQDPKQTVYVWFDALNGYLSGLLPPDAPPSLDALPSSGWPADLHIIGKDILRFHAVYWPGMLLSAGLPLPRAVFGHGFLTKDGLKMGKSMGNVLDPVALVGGYGADAVRFYFMKEVSFGQDGNFSEQHFRDTCNAALANNLGNMLNRTINLLAKNCGGAVPADAAALPADHPLRAIVTEKVPEAAAAYGELRFHQAIEAVMAITGRGNQYLEERAPWTAFKKGTEEDKAAAREVLAAVLETARIAAVALSPVTPALSERTYQQLGLADSYGQITWADTNWGQLQAGHALATPEPVFARIAAEQAFVTEPAAASAPAAKSPKTKTAKAPQQAPVKA